MEKTVAMVKSGAALRGDSERIVARATENGLSIARRFDGSISVEQASEFYGEHRGRPYFQGLLDSVTGEAGIVALVLTGDGAIAKWRSLLGATDPAKAEPGTIRGDFGRLLPDNAAHGSDSAESAAREETILFG